MTDVKPSYFAILTADVRYSKEITPNAKLLFAEISALSNKEGYCWASNSYFSSLYDVDNRTITRWIKSLEKAGFVSLVYEFHQDKKSVKRRYIKLSTGVTKLSGGGDKNVQEGVTKLSSIIIQENNTYSSKKSFADRQHEAAEKHLARLDNYEF